MTAKARLGKLKRSSAKSRKGKARADEVQLLIDTADGLASTGITVEQARALVHASDAYVAAHGRWAERLDDVRPYMPPNTYIEIKALYKKACGRRWKGEYVPPPAAYRASRRTG